MLLHGTWATGQKGRLEVLGSHLASTWWDSLRLWGWEGMSWPHRMGGLKPQALGHHPMAAPHPPSLSPDVHEVFIHAPGCLGCDGHRDPVALRREGDQG